MSMMRCCHCWRTWDSDQDEWCPVCNNLEPSLIDSAHEGRPGEPCHSCGLELAEGWGGTD